MAVRANRLARSAKTMLADQRRLGASRPTVALACALTCPSCGEVSSHISRDGAADTADAAAAPPDAAPAEPICTLVAPGPVALHLRGSAVAVRDFGDPESAGVLTEELDLYLPEGRVAGGRAIVAFTNSIGSHELIVGVAHFNTDLSAASIELSGVRGGTVRYGVAFPQGAASPRASVSRNLELYVDVPRLVRAEMTLCPAGASPDPRLNLGPPLTPVSALTLTATTPFGTGVDGVRLLADGAPVTATVVRQRESVVITPTRPLRPRTRLTLDAASLRDVMGRPYAPGAQPALLRTTATVADWTFSAPPPDGAVASSVGVSVRDGALTPMLHLAQPYRVVIALGAPPAGAAALELRYALSGPCADRLGAWFVSEAGDAAALALSPAGGAGLSARATVPAGGDLWLVFESTQRENTPGWGVPVTACSLVVDEVRAAP